MVDYYKSKLPQKKGGLLPDEGWDENAMDQLDRIFVNGCTYEYDLGGLYCRKYTSDIVDANDVPIPGKRAGDIICGQNGLPIVFDKISVFCQYAFKTEAIFDEFGMPVIDPVTGFSKVKVMRDENGRPIEEWVAGWSPKDVGESMRRLLTPYNADTVAEMPSMQGGEPGGSVVVEESPQIFQQQQNGTAQPGGQPTVQPGTTTTQQ
jgi:hypothetical protein